MPDAPAVVTEPQAGLGYACSEGSRDVLFHQYRIDEQGL
jgi:coenzyme F420-reducing hydrogenase alpha subunit